MYILYIWGKTNYNNLFLEEMSQISAYLAFINLFNFINIVHFGPYCSSSTILSQLKPRFGCSVVQDKDTSDMDGACHIKARVVSISCIYIVFLDYELSDTESDLMATGARGEEEIEEIHRN